jgi:hypothetical protein
MTTKKVARASVEIEQATDPKYVAKLVFWEKGNGKLGKKFERHVGHEKALDLAIKLLHKCRRR